MPTVDTIAMQLEKVRPNMEKAFPQDNTLWSEIKTRPVEKNSLRGYVVPLQLTGGGKTRGFDPRGGGLGRGSGFEPTKGLLFPFFVEHAIEWTAANDWSTDSKEKAIESYVSRLMDQAMGNFNSDIESLLCGSTGANEITTLTAAPSGNSCTVSNANQLRDSNTYQVFSALGAANLRGDFTVRSSDFPNDTVYVEASDPFPAGSTTNDTIILDGCSGDTDSGIFGIPHFHVGTNTGSVMGVPRATWAGRLNTPYVNGNNQAITPTRARLLQAKMQKAMGIKSPDQLNVQYNMNVDQVAAWENVGIVRSSVIQNQVSGNESVDMLKKNAPKTFAGRPIIGGLGNIHAKKGRIDGLALKHMFRIENKPLDYYEVGGQTVFPAYDSVGGIATSSMTYLVVGFQIGHENPKAGVYIDNLASPTGY